MEQKITELLQKISEKLGSMEPTAVEAFKQLIEREKFYGAIGVASWVIIVIIALVGASFFYREPDGVPPFIIMIIFSAISLFGAMYCSAMIFYPIASLIK